MLRGPVTTQVLALREVFIGLDVAKARHAVAVAEARLGIGSWLAFYNDERPHQALDYRTPRAVFEAAPACGYVDNAAATLCFAAALPTYPQAQQQQGCID